VVLPGSLSRDAQVISPFISSAFGAGILHWNFVNSLSRTETSETTPLLGKSLKDATEEPNGNLTHRRSLIMFALIIAPGAIEQATAQAYIQLLMYFLCSPPPTGPGFSSTQYSWLSAGTAVSPMVLVYFLFAKMAERFGYVVLYRVSFVILAVTWFCIPTLTMGVNDGRIQSTMVLLCFIWTLRRISDLVCFTCRLTLVPCP